MSPKGVMGSDQIRAVDLFNYHRSRLHCCCFTHLFRVPHRLRDLNVLPTPRPSYDLPCLHIISLYQVGHEDHLFPNRERGYLQIYNAFTDKLYIDYIRVVHRPRNLSVSICTLSMLGMAPSPPVLRIQPEFIARRGCSEQAMEANPF